MRNARPTRLSDHERQQLLSSCADIAALWREHATTTERQQITRLLLQRVTVQVHHNSDRVSVQLHWSGGFESGHEITRRVMRFDQLESYQELLDRTLALALAGQHSREIATVLKAEGFRAPRTGERISADMVQKLFCEPHCRRQLDDPPLEPGQWRSTDLANELGIAEKRLKHWVTRGWATAIQRPHGRTWVIYADEQELARLQQLLCSQTGRGKQAPPEMLRTPTPVPRKQPLKPRPRRPNGLPIQTSSNQE